MFRPCFGETLPLAGISGARVPVQKDAGARGTERQIPLAFWTGSLLRKEQILLMQP